MSNSFAARLRPAFMIAGVAFSLWITVAHAQVIAPLSEIKITVFDQAGAVIPNSEVTFKSHSKTIVSHTGMDGMVKIMLPSSQYTVTTNHFGFVKNKVSDFQVTAPEPNKLKVVMELASAIICTLPCGPYVDLAVPTTTSDLPNFIEYEPDPDSLAQPIAQKTRSWQCLYLWKCVSLDVKF